MPGTERQSYWLSLKAIAPVLIASVLLPAIVLAAAAWQGVSRGNSAIVAASLEPGQLFELTNIWTIHLRFTPEQWTAMEPKGGPGGFGGPSGPAPFGGGRGPAEGGQAEGGAGPRRDRGPGGFGPAMFLAPTFLNQGDLNHDGKLSGDEFNALGQKWFAAWDTNKTGQLDAAKIRAGLNVTFGGGPGPGQNRAGGPAPQNRGFGGGGPGLQGAEGKRNGIASAMGVEFTYVHADLEFEGARFKDVAVRYKGNGTFLESRGSLKRSLKIELNKYVGSQKLAGQTKLNLHNNVTDASWMNEVLAFRLYRDARVPAARTSYARVFVTVPGKFDQKYFGLYSLVEEVDKHFAEENFGTKRGALFKPVTPDLFGYLGEDWRKYKQTYDPKTELFDEQTSRVIEFSRLLTQASDTEFNARVGEYIDLDEFARFMAVMVWLSDLDGILGPGQNFYLYLHPKSQLFEFIPWDQDHSFGQFGMRGTQEQRENLSIHKPWQGENRFLDRMFKVAAFKKLYLERLAEFSQSIFKPGRLTRQVDQLAATIRPAVEQESEAKLARFDKAVAGEPLSSGGFGPFGGQSIKPIKAFAGIRTGSVVDQLAGKSNGQTIGGFGFPGGGQGGPAGGGGPGGPPDFGPGMFLGNVFLNGLDQNKDGVVTADEFTQGFRHWFETWNEDHSGALTDDQLRAGINRDLSPFRSGPANFFRPPGQQ